MSDKERNYDLQAEKQSQIDAPVLAYRPPEPKQAHRIGLIGCGGISESHLKAYQHAGFEVVAFADIERDRAVARCAAFYPQAQVFDDYRALLQGADVDVVDVATHPEPRVEIIEAALCSGRHVLSQKPFVLDLATGLHLSAVAQTYGRVLAVNQNGRWAPHFSYIREAVAAGYIGEVVSVNITIHWDHNWIVGTPFDQMQHVVLQDFAIHWFDFVASIVPGLPQRIFASVLRSLSQKAQVPLMASVLMEYPKVRVNLSFDADTTRGPEDRTVVRGTQGTLYSVGPSLTEQTVTGYTEAGWFQPELAGTWFLQGFQGTMAELLCAIDEQRRPLNEARDNLRGLAMCFTAAHSADQGGVLEVAPVGEDGQA
jgi:predicted dehydrogenase